MNMHTNPTNSKINKSFLNFFKSSSTDEDVFMQIFNFTTVIKCSVTFEKSGLTFLFKVSPAPRKLK